VEHMVGRVRGRRGLGWGEGKAGCGLGWWGGSWCRERARGIRQRRGGDGRLESPRPGLGAAAAYTIGRGGRRGTAAEAVAGGVEAEGGGRDVQDSVPAGAQARVLETCNSGLRRGGAGVISTFRPREAGGRVEGRRIARQRQGSVLMETAEWRGGSVGISLGKRTGGNGAIEGVHARLAAEDADLGSRGRRDGATRVLVALREPGV
jgi:hypothetical protein